VSHFFRQLDGGIVQRHCQCEPGSHVAVIYLFVITRLVDLVAVSEGARLVGHNRGRREYWIAAVKGRIHSGGVNERFEDGSSRTFRYRVVQLAEGVVSSPDQG